MAASKLKYIALTATALILLNGCAKIFQPGDAQKESGAGLKSRIDCLLNTAGSNAVWSVKIIENHSGATVYARNPAKTLIPASNLKLFTTAAALEFLGSDYRYATAVITDGEIDSAGCLTGDLYIIGSGDPAISARFHSDSPLLAFEGWVDCFKELGITAVEGGLIGVDTVFSADRALESTWEWGDLRYSFAAPASGLCFNENCLRIEVFIPIFKDTVLFKTIPEYPGIRVVSDLRIFNPLKRSRVFWDWHIPDSILYLGGGLVGQDRKSLMIPVNDPAMHFLRSFKSTLRVEGIEIYGELKTVREPLIDSNPELLRDTLYLHYSPPLIEICRIINVESVNFFAEQLLRTLGSELYGEGSPEAGLQVVWEMLENAGILPESIHLVDGSGLSRHNWVSAEAMVKLMTHCQRSDFADDFLSALPQYGEGTLEKRTAPSQYCVVKAKSGSMSGVRAFTGVVYAPGKEFAFSFICNNYTVPSRQVELAIDSVIAEICGF